MGYVVLGRAVSVDLVDANGAITQQNFIVPQGRKLPDNVAPFMVNALKSSGVIAYAADPSTNIGEPTVREVEPPAQVRTQDQPPILPSDPVGNRIISGEESPEEAQPEEAEVDTGNLDPADLVGVASLGGAPDAGGEPAAEESGGEPAKPKSGDSKQAWEEYAVSQGVDQGEAESLTKRELIARFEQA